MKEQQSFILYHDMWDQLKELTDEERGIILKGIFIYHSTGEIIDMGRLLNIIFKSIQSMLDRDRVKYVEVIQSKSDNGKKGGRPKKEAKKANALFDKLKKLDKATQADSVSVPDSDSVPDIDTYETDIPKGIGSQAIVAIEKIDKRNTGTQRILEIVQSEVEGNGFIYEKHRDDRYRATIIAKRQSEWGSFIGDSSEESEEKAIRSIISFSNQNEFVKRIRNVYDFHEKWKSVANSMKLQNKENIKNAPNPDPLLRF